jgi:crossover junction endodeoxyribonuclease RusA
MDAKPGRSPALLPEPTPSRHLNQDPLRTPVRFLLPWPPTVNRHWRIARPYGGQRGALMLSAQGVEYRRRVKFHLLSQGVRAWQLEGALALDVFAFPPDRRARDLDNLLKPLLDALEAAGVVANDSSFARLTIERAEVEPPRGRVDVHLARWLPRRRGVE